MNKYFIYLRVSSEQQRDNCRYSYQQDCLVKKATQNAWDYEVHKEVRSAKNIEKRPVIKNLLQRLANKEANGIMVVSVDRLTRSNKDANTLLEISAKQGWKIYVDNIYSPIGSVAWRDAFLHDSVKSETEINVLSERTKQGIRASPNAETMGARRFPSYSPEMLKRISYLRDRKKMTFADIATKLNNEGILPPRASIRGCSDKWNGDKVRDGYLTV